MDVIHYDEINLHWNLVSINIATGGWLPFDSFQMEGIIGDWLHVDLSPDEMTPRQEAERQMTNNLIRFMRVRNPQYLMSYI